MVPNQVENWMKMITEPSRLQSLLLQRRDAPWSSGAWSQASGWEVMWRLWRETPASFPHSVWIRQWKQYFWYFYVKAEIMGKEAWRKQIRQIWTYSLLPSLYVLTRASITHQTFQPTGLTIKSPSPSHYLQMAWSTWLHFREQNPNVTSFK